MPEACPEDVAEDVAVTLPLLEFPSITGRVGVPMLVAVLGSDAAKEGFNEEVVDEEVVAAWVNGDSVKRVEGVWDTVAELLAVELGLAVLVEEDD